MNIYVVLEHNNILDLEYCYIWSTIMNGYQQSMWNANFATGVQFPACARSRMLTAFHNGRQSCKIFFFINIFPKKTTVWCQLYMFRPQKVIEKDRTIYVLSGKKKPNSKRRIRSLDIYTA